MKTMGERRAFESAVPGPLSPMRVAPEAEETLDPADWESFRSLAHGMLDELIDFQRDAGTRPGWRPVPAAVDAELRAPAPREGRGSEGAWAAFRDLVLPYPTGLHHPRWWGWAGGTGSPMGMMAAMLGAGMNAVPGNFDDAAARVEAQLLDWMKAAMGFPASASGIVTGGGSVANLVGLTVARDAALGASAEADGVRASPGRLVLYASSEVHSSVHKGAKLLGLGRDAVRTVGVDEAFRVRVDELAEKIQRDRAAGLAPFAIVGTAGTINTGSVDDLHALADLAQAEGLWLHVDGAFGAMAALSPETRHLVDGMARADSLAFDFHKWLYVNYEAGCALVRDADAHRRSFAAAADYLAPPPRGVGARKDPAGGRGLQLSRGFKALKPWMSIQEQGLDKLGRLIAQNVRQASYFAELVDRSKWLTRVAPVALNVVAFRHDDPSLESSALDELNRELLMRIHERGLAIPSSTLLGGRVTLRVCICNHRSRRSDFEEFVAGAESLVRELRGVGT